MNSDRHPAMAPPHPRTRGALRGLRRLAPAPCRGASPACTTGCRSRTWPTRRSTSRSSSSSSACAQDKLVVAFVAEFSRGKSELINAIFFADFGAAAAAVVGGPHDDVPDRAPVRRRARRRRSACCRSRRALQGRDGRRVQELRRRVGDVPARPRGRRPDERGARAGVAGQARAGRARAQRYGLARRRGPPRAAARPAARRRSTSRAGATRSSTSRIRCCSRAS